jgi:ribose-phosphate pyrophosphokinase
MQIIPCQNSIELATKIASTKRFELVIPRVRYFTGKEMQVTIPTILGKEVYIIQSFSASVNDALIELLLTINAARNSGADIINVIAPYLGYSRQDKIEDFKSHGLGMIAHLLSSCTIHQLITIDFHSPGNLYLFPITVKNISTQDLILPLTKNKVIVTPDNGASRRNHFDNVIQLNKKRIDDNLYFELHGDVSDQDCLIVDDIIDSGRTICQASEILIKNGAKSVEAYVTHALFSNETCNRINNSLISKLYISNSITNNFLPDNLDIIDLTKIIIQRLSF